MSVQTILKFLKNNPLLCIVVLLSPYLIVKSIYGGEFNTYLEAAKQLRAGVDCYNIWLTHDNGTSTQYGYSPLFATLLIPFTFLPSWVPSLLFLLADVVMLFRVFRLITEWLQLKEFSGKNLWLSLVLIFSLRFILHNFEMVQLNIFLLWLSLEGLQQIFFSKRILLGTFLISLGINFKILPVVFVPYLLYRKEFQSVGLICGWGLLFAILPASVFGFDFNTQLHSEWLNIINPFNEKYGIGQNIESYRIHGLSALFVAYFSKYNNDTFQWLIVSLSDQGVQLLTTLSRLAFITLTFYFLRRKPFSSFQSSRHFAYEVSYLLLITPLIFPQQNKWAFVYILPALGLIFYSLLQKQKSFFSIKVVLLLAVFILTTLTTDGIIGKQLNYYTECLKLVTIGTILIVPILMLSKPEET